MSGLVNSAGAKSGIIGSTEIPGGYEEGDYTYTLPFSSSGSLTPRTGYTKLKYIKIGRMCSVFGKIETDGGSSPSGQMRLTLPFTAGACADSSATTNSSGITTHYRNSGLTTDDSFFDIPENNAYGQFWRIDHDGTKNQVTDSNIDTSFELYLNISYHTAT